MAVVILYLKWLDNPMSTFNPWAVVWDLWRYWGRFFCKFFGFPLPVIIPPMFSTVPTSEICDYPAHFHNFTFLLGLLTQH